MKENIYGMILITLTNEGYPLDYQPTFEEFEKKYGKLFRADGSKVTKTKFERALQKIPKGFKLRWIPVNPIEKKFQEELTLIKNETFTESLERIISSKN